jgi:futalosine hydrolase
MEGAAFHYVCLMEQVPFIQFRAVSNYVAQRDKTKWKLKQAIQTLNDKLVFILQELSIS